MDFDFTSEAPGFKSKRNSTESWMFGKTVIELQGLPGRVKGSTNYRIVLSEAACGQLGVTDTTNVLTLWDKKDAGIFIGNVSSLTLAKSDQLVMSKQQSATEIKRARVCRNKTVLEGLGDNGGIEEGAGIGFYTLEPCLDGQSIPVAKLKYLGENASSTDALTSAPNTFVDVLENNVGVTDLAPGSPGHITQATGPVNDPVPNVQSVDNSNPFADEEPDNVLDAIAETSPATPGNSDDLSW